MEIRITEQACIQMDIKNITYTEENYREITLKHHNKPFLPAVNLLKVYIIFLIRQRSLERGVNQRVTLNSKSTCVKINLEFSVKNDWYVLDPRIILIGPISYPKLTHIKGYRSINKKFF